MSHAQQTPEGLYPIKPRDARDEWIDHQSVDLADSTIRSHRQRLRHFVRWCDDQDITSIHQLDGRTLHQYDRHRRGQGLAATTLKGELTTLRNFIEFCERIECAPEGLSEKIDPPTPSKHEEVSETVLKSGRALRLLDHLRSEEYGTRDHALFEFMWSTGARAGAVAGVDVTDYDSDAEYVEFRHQPAEDTPLKNKYDGERPVSLPSRVCDALDAYLDGRDRYNTVDDYGREPLFTSRYGRPKPGTIRDWMYRLTVPCRVGECPHDVDPDECEALNKPNGESACPSSRSPHPVRSGSISWQLACGIPMELVEARVNASREVILRHYDLRGEHAKMEQRRNHIIPHLNYTKA
ncbi:tyrosine-type recombinase/integrase [Haloarchaeobius sp. DYHT-AS-18]|uniref:tyrosine-type recombinase/integrase n=1 Tax=Haloarchaeobius sp. DYHT-AS-18 TaxID=3446117 RepID=UPI003EBA6515